MTDARHSIFLDVLWFAPAYGGSVCLLMLVNTELGVIEHLHGASWWLYGPYWSAVFAPAALSALVAVRLRSRVLADAGRILLQFLAVILLTVEVLFVLQVDLPDSIAVVVILAIGFFVSVWLRRRADD